MQGQKGRKFLCFKSSPSFCPLSLREPLLEQTFIHWENEVKMCMKQQLHWIQMQMELFIGLLWCQAKGITLPAPSMGPGSDPTSAGFALVHWASHSVSYLLWQWSNKPWEIFTLSQRKSRQPVGQMELGGRRSAEDEWGGGRAETAGSEDERARRSGEQRFPPVGFH